MIGEVAGGEAWTAWHGGSCSEDAAVMSRKDSRPLLLVPLRVRYSLESNGDLEILDDLQWADWSRNGHLLVATRSGLLQIRNLESNGFPILFEADLSNLEPTPTAAPDWAQRW